MLKCRGVSVRCLPCRNRVYPVPPHGYYLTQYIIYEHPKKHKTSGKVFREKLPMQGSTRSIAAEGGRNVASRAKRALIAFSGNFRRRENSPLLVRGNAPKTPLERARCAAARFCETLRSVTVIAGHAPFSSPPRARFCPAYDPRSACGAAARASHRANAGIRHTPPFSPIAAWRIPPASP